METPLSLTDFATQLIQSGDLDPVYLMLNREPLDYSTTARWCLAYWMFYHSGVASKCAEAPDFWDTVWIGYEEKWPRGTERRHFRGKNAEKSIAYLSNRFREPEKAIHSLGGGPADPNRDTPHSFTAVARRVQEWTGFGPWIAFKVCDMLDAVLGVPIDFSEAVPHGIFEDPAKGAVHAWRGRAVDTVNDTWSRYTPEDRQLIVKEAFEYAAVEIGYLTVPHLPKQRIRTQEIETIFCKWKSHLNGRYPIGKDTHEILHQLEGWGPLADRLRTRLAHG